MDNSMSFEFATDAAPLQAKLDRALAMLRGNLQRVMGYDPPVLYEGAEYPGVWLECAPMEGLVYGQVDPAIAIRNHDVFFRLQRADGYLPCFAWARRHGAGQIQMVVPIAATAWETHLQWPDPAFLEKAYAACRRWDDWLRRYRDTRGTGLCEAFCEYDTGHDNSPRCGGWPKAGLDGDARRCAPADGMPVLAPDLSATVYGGRIALARMAEELGRPDEAANWRQSAEHIRRQILAWCYDPESGAFYDVNTDGQWVRIRGDATTRVLGEHGVDDGLFDDIYRRQIRNERAFWTPYPLPSIAADDPHFVRDMPVNSWGGASQALTALRAPRWMEHYGRFADLAHLMRQWVRAIVAGSGFYQQISPFTGEFTPSADGYSPCLLVLVDFVARLYGISTDGRRLQWNCRLPEGATRSRHVRATPYGQAALSNERGTSHLTLDGKLLATVTGTGRVVTDARRRVVGAVGTSAGELTLRMGDAERTLVMKADEVVQID